MENKKIEDILKIEKEKINFMFEIAEKDTLAGFKMRQFIDRICWYYTHR